MFPQFNATFGYITDISTVFGSKVTKKHFKTIDFNSIKKAMVFITD